MYRISFIMLIPNCKVASWELRSIPLLVNSTVTHKYLNIWGFLFYWQNLNSLVAGHICKQWGNRSIFSTREPKWTQSKYYCICNNVYIENIMMKTL